MILSPTHAPSRNRDTNRCLECKLNGKKCEVLPVEVLAGWERQILLYTDIMDLLEVNGTSIVADAIFRKGDSHVTV